MTTQIEDAYFEWLCGKISDRGSSRYKYTELLKVLYQTEFFWLILGDDNRAQDGLDLRDAFLRERLIEEEPVWSSIMCSVLEMLVAFAYKADFQTEDGVSEWFWEFMDNLHLSEFTDESIQYEAVEEIIDTFMYRTFDPDGQNGGLFPLEHTSRNDQRKVEIWYQFSEYIIEQNRI